MFLRVLGDSLLRQKRRKAVALTAIALGTTAATAIAAIGLDVGDRINRELKSFGANLVVLPRGGSGAIVVGGEDLAALSVPAYLPAGDIMKVKDNFWKNNILGFAPILDVPARIGGRHAVLRGAWFERSAAVPGDPAEGTSAALTGLRVMNPYWSVEGQWPAEPAAPSAPSPLAAPGVLIGRTLAQSLELAPGDRVTI